MALRRRRRLQNMARKRTAFAAWSGLKVRPPLPPPPRCPAALSPPYGLGQAKRAVARRVLARLTRGKLAAAFAGLRDAAAALRLQRLGMRRAMSRILSACLAGAWNTWRDHLLRVHRARRVMRRVRNRQLARPWAAWADAVGEQRRLLAGLRRVMRRIRAAP